MSSGSGQDEEVPTRIETAEYTSVAGRRTRGLSGLSGVSAYHLVKCVNATPAAVYVEGGKMRWVAVRLSATVVGAGEGGAGAF